MLEQARLDQFGQGAVDGGPAELALDDQVVKVLHKLFGVEVVVVTEDLLDDHPPLSGDPLAAGLQELRKAFVGGELHLHRLQRKALRHDRLSADFVQQAIDRPVELVGGFVGAVRDLPRIWFMRSHRTSGACCAWSTSRAASEMLTSSWMGPEPDAAGGCESRAACGAPRG